MTELGRIADLVKRAYDGPAWSGPSLVEVLQEISSTEAAARPLEGAHSIWEIVAHIAAWEEVVTRRLRGEAKREYSQDEDWPPVRDTSEAGWSALLMRLKTTNLELRQAILAFEQSRLSGVVPGADYSFYVMMHGAVHHDLYHAGQIAVLKRAHAAHRAPRTLSA